MESISGKLRSAMQPFAKTYPGESGRRQPVHTVYGGAHLFKSDSAGRLVDFRMTLIVMHGDGWDLGFSGIRQRALDTGARPPAQGGDEVDWLHAFLDARVWAMKQEPAHEDTSRVDTAQRRFLNEGKLNLERPLQWHVYGQAFEIR